MEDTTPELTERFERYCTTSNHELPPEILNELQSILRLYSVSPEELYFKWEAYSLKMGGEEMKLDAKTLKEFRNNIRDALERESRGKAAQAKNEAKRVAPTPRAGAKGSAGVFDM